MPIWFSDIFAHMVQIWPVLALLFLAGMANNVADIAENPAWFNQSWFKEKNPVWIYPEYIGHKNETWVNKYNPDQSGPRFWGAKTVFVAFTDLWHGAKSLFLTLLTLAILFYVLPAVWWYYLVDFLIFKLVFSIGWHTANLSLR